MAKRTRGTWRGVSVRPLTKSGAVHKHGAGFTTRWLERLRNGAGVVVGRVLHYRHGQTYGKHIATQHQRVAISRAARLGLPVQEYEARGASPEWQGLMSKARSEGMTLLQYLRAHPQV